MKDGDELGGDGIYDEGIDSDPLKRIRMGMAFEMGKSSTTVGINQSTDGMV